MFFVPHGENVILLLKDHVPARMVLKDFVEEVQLAPDAYHETAPEIRKVLYEIPQEDVTLFIFTDIFDGFFRYLSALLSSYLIYDEQLFWKQVADVINDYQQEFPDLHERYQKYDLFAGDFKRFCLNRFRLVTSGYQESADAPAVPPFAGTLENPIAMYKRSLHK
jgi:siderophore synthetase component